MTLWEPEATDLSRLGQLTGQTLAEVAAVVLAQQLRGDSAEQALSAAAVALRSLYIQRRQTLGVASLPALAPTLHLPVTGSQGMPIRIPLSALLSEEIFAHAIETGLEPAEIAQILLRMVNLKALAEAIGLAAYSGSIGWWVPPPIKDSDQLSPPNDL